MTLMERRMLTDDHGGADAHGHVSDHGYGRGRGHEYVPWLPGSFTYSFPSALRTSNWISIYWIVLACLNNNKVELIRKKTPNPMQKERNDQTCSCLKYLKDKTDLNHKVGLQWVIINPDPGMVHTMVIWLSGPWINPLLNWQRANPLNFEHWPLVWKLWKLRHQNYALPQSFR